MSKLPDDDLMAMTLRALLMVIRVLGTFRTIADKGAQPTTEIEVIQAATRVLENWPFCFKTLLEDLGEQVPSDVSGGVARQFDGIYRALFRNRAIERGATGFLRDAFLEFAMNDWGRGYVDHKLIKEERVSAPKRFLTQTEFAARIGVRQVTVARWLKASGVTATRVKCGRASRILVDANLNAIPGSAQDKVLRKREAAKRLGISVSVLQGLKDFGIYEVKNLPPTRAGFHELDLRALSEKFFALLPEAIPQNTSVIKGTKLQVVVRGRHDTIATKVSFLRAVLQREIAIVGRSNRTIGGLLLDKSVSRTFLLKARSGTEGKVNGASGSRIRTPRY